MFRTLKQKAAAFRRGGFLLFVLALFLVPASPASALDEEVRDDMVRLFVLANTEFTILHEFGHAMIHQFSIPVFGQEEDAADQIATTAMILKYDADVDPQAIDRLLAVSSEWLSEWHQQTAERGNSHAFWDSHSLAIQRFYNINCLLYGANPDDLEFLLDSEALPAERGFDCDQAYAQALHAYRWLFEAHGRTPDASIPYVGIIVDFEEPRTPRHAMLKDWIVDSQLARDLAARATEFFPWPEPVTLFFDNCPGSPDAYYNRNVGEIVVCYELIELFLDKSEKSLSRNVGLVFASIGLRRLFGDRLACDAPEVP